MSAPPKTPYTVHIAHELRHSPDVELRQLIHFFSAGGGDWRQLGLHELRDALALHRGDHDVPSGLTEQDLKTSYSPLDINVEVFEGKILEGKRIIQWIVEGCTRIDEAHQNLLPQDEWGDRPEYEDGVQWISVQEACKEKDVESPAVYRAVDTGLIDGLRHEGSMFVAPNEKYENWSPSRRSSSLVRRYVKIIRSILASREPEHLTDLYQEAEARAEEAFGSANAVELFSFFDRVWGDEAPSSIMDWYKRIES